jgi:hypothetical protein
MLNRLLERSAPLAWLAIAACGGVGTAAPPLLDEAWCDISAIPCLIATQTDDGLPIACSVLGSDPVPASALGDRICFAN